MRNRKVTTGGIVLLVPLAVLAVAFVLLKACL